MKNHHWYRVLRKPSWAPPEWLFAPVWAVLYVLMAVSFGYVGFMFFKGMIAPGILVLFVINVLLNMSFTPILFGFHNLSLATLDVFLTFLTLIWALALIFPFASWIVFANLPYALWLGFASALQFKIMIINNYQQNDEISLVV